MRHLRRSIRSCRSFVPAEITFEVEQRIRTDLTDTPFSHLHSSVSEIVVAQTVSPAQLDRYATETSFSLPSMDAAGWESYFHEVVRDDEGRMELARLVEGAMKEPMRRSAADKAPWRTLTIPVDLPSISVRLRPPPSFISR